MIAPSNPGTDPRTSMFNNNTYFERRGKEIYKMHKTGTFFSPECAVYVNRLLNQIFFAHPSCMWEKFHKFASTMIKTERHKALLLRLAKECRSVRLLELMK